MQEKGGDKPTGLKSSMREDPSEPSLWGMLPTTQCPSGTLMVNISKDWTRHSL